MDAVYIAGVGMHAFGRFPEKSLTALGAHALRSALKDAEIELAAVNALYCGTCYGGVGAGHKVLGALGATSIPIVNVEAGCASGAAALALGVMALRAQAYDCVAVLGMEKMPKGMIRSSFFERWHEQAGLAVTPAYFALRAQQVLREEGLDVPHLAEVVVKNRGNGAANPCAMFRTAVTVEDVLASPVVCEPLRLWMLCSPNEGAACVILSRKPKAGPRPVRVAAVALRSHHFGNVLGEHTPLSGCSRGVPPSASELAAHDAYEASGFGPGDIHVVECQDTDAARELLAWRELGLCKAGECARALREKWFHAGGRTPVNLSGGLLSKGEPLGASALGQVVYLAWLLQERAPGQSRLNLRVALAHTVGRGANASVAILVAE
ncbi:MAG: thiolase family protein [Candidatus Binatia bacterium]|nr:thiolase family protein [Candidatus Binatia bacterium]